MNKIKELKIDKKKYLDIAIIFACIIAITLVGTFALKLWTSTNNTELTFRIGEYSTEGITCKSREDITVSNIGPVFDYEKDGEVITFRAIAASSNTTPLNVSFNISTITNNLKETSFKYALMSSTDKTNYTEILKGDFSNVSNGTSIDLIKDKVITKTTYYKLIIYIDGNMENPTSMQNGSLTGNVEMCIEGGDIEINSFKVDGVETTTFPLSSGYNIDTTCSDANITFDYKSQSYEISNITKKRAKCSINYTTKTNKTYLNNYIKGLAGTTQGTGQVVNENGYRYEGKNPNNYIYFNNELWRIIGVFDASSHGKTGEYLTKIIRNDSLGGYAWDKSGNNNWATSSLYNLLNTNYYNATDGTGGGNCYQYFTEITGNCDYTETGLQSEYRTMVENVTWYLGGKDDNTYTADAFYTGERDSTSVYSGNTASITGYIGLMYASDYGYSVLSSSCARTIDLISYSTSACGGASWLKKEAYEWTVTPYSDRSYFSFILDDTASLYSSNANYGSATRPVLYLKSNVQVYAGDGSISKPYQIKLAS